jgi:hypothetical protein
MEFVLKDQQSAAWSNCLNIRVTNGWSASEVACGAATDAGNLRQT